MATPRKKIIRGRPVGSSSRDPLIALAFGKTVVKLRDASALGQEKLGLEAGIGRSNMSAIENGRTAPSLRSIVKIAEALGCGLPKLMTEFDRTLRSLRNARDAEPDQS